MSNNTLITSDIVTWTPAQAREALATMTRNRGLSNDVAERYAMDMAAGRWRFAADPVRFGADGALIDGQHRLTAHASLPEGTVIQYFVVRGLDQSSQLVMDQGRRRIAGQQLQMLGVKNGNTVAAGVRLYLAMQDGVLFRDNKFVAKTVTTARIENWVSANAESVGTLDQYMNAIRKGTDAPGSVSYAAALAFHHRDSAAARLFFEVLHAGGGGANSPITVLDKRLQRHRKEGIKVSSRDVLGMYILAWNAWRAGREVTKIQRPRGEGWTAQSFPVAL